MATRTNNPLFTKSNLTNRVRGLIVAAEIRWEDAKKKRGKQREQAIRDAYAQAMTARYIAVELLDDDALEDEVNKILEPIMWSTPTKKNPGTEVRRLTNQLT